jgi:hypothetical protein
MTQSKSFSSFTLLYLDNGKALQGKSWDVTSKEGSLHDDIAKLSHLTLVMSADGAIRHCRIFENSETFAFIRCATTYDWTHSRYQAIKLGPWALGRVFYLMVILAGLLYRLLIRYRKGQTSWLNFRKCALPGHS